MYEQTTGQNFTTFSKNVNIIECHYLKSPWKMHSNKNKHAWYCSLEIVIEIREFCENQVFYFAQ